MRYRDRIARVVVEARGQRVIIESIDDTGRLHKSPVKWTSLEPYGEQVFWGAVMDQLDIFDNSRDVMLRNDITEWRLRPAYPGPAGQQVS
jgi:hypothetical protein